MLKRIINSIIRARLGLLLLSGQFIIATTVQAEGRLEQKLRVCQQEASALLRLDCYDKILKPKETEPVSSIKRSERVLKMLQQEQQRTEHSTQFITQQDKGNISPEVIITTPALGITPPRPILVFSCIDNITQMQIIFFKPLPASSRSLVLKTNTGTELNSTWFIRDGGYVLESSRGLPGISQIQRLFNAETLHIESENNALNGLSFDIKNLAQEIVPLRQACRW